MTLVHTREEALAFVDSALAKFDVQVGGLLTQATAVASGAVQQAEDVVRRCEAKVGALESVSAVAEEEDRRRLQAELVRAREHLNQARRAHRRVADVSEGVRALQRSYALQCSPIVAAGRGNLAGRVGAVQQYLSGGGGGASGESGGSSGAGPNNLGTALAALGMTNVSATTADLDNTPIQDGFTRGGLSRADYRWAVQTWNDTVGPGIARGMTRNDFAARDNREPPAPSLRRTVDVYDMFLGSDAIRADRRPDGSLNIINGRHRLQIARELGIKDLPGRVFE
ncbi:MAG TPA: hypothetical protein VGG75_31660 [Trebonia sp.]